MLRDAPRRPPTANSLRRFVMSAAIAGLALLTALWSVAPPAAASSHCASQDSAALIRDCRTLMDLKDDLDPHDRLNWAEDLPMTFDSWDGVFSTAEDGVTSIRIYESMQSETDLLTLGGTVPAGLGSLPNLRFLEMWRVGLTGSIPAELGNLSNLEELRLDQNSLTGSIPTGLGSLSNLRYMSLTLNQLSGGIPSDFGNMSSLEYLSLDRNFLGLQTHPTAGNPAPSAVNNPIPASLGNLGALQGLDLGDNNFSGSIPSALGNLRELTSLGLSGNNFSGNIPSALGNLSKLEGLNAWGNQLSGSIPSQLGNLAALEHLDLAYNGLRNSIPGSLGRLSKLEYLSLAENDLSGSIPSQLGNLTNLRKLYLDTNRLSGSIPADLGDLTALDDLNLARNELSGAIPSELGDLASIKSLNLNDNGLSSNIPAELADPRSLRYVSLSCNLLTGDIPSEFGDLPNLRVLLLHRNSLNAPTGADLTKLEKIPVFWYSTENACPRGQPDVQPPATDAIPPSFEEAEMSRDGLSILLTYDESLDSSNGPSTAAFTVKVDGQAVTVSTVSVRIRQVSVGLGAAVTENQGVTVAYADPTSGNDANAIQDRSGNDAASLPETRVQGESAVEDGVAPEFLSAALSTDGNTITLTYDEILNSRAGPRSSDFQVMVEGEPRNVSRVRVSDRQVELRLASPVTVRQSVVVSYIDPTAADDANAIQDRSGNDAADLIDHEITNTSTAQDNRAPRFVRAELSTDGLSLTLLYDEVLDEEAGPSTSDFSVDVDGDSAEPSQVELSGRTVVLTLATEVRELQDVAVSYTDPSGVDDASAIQDVGGNDAASLIDHKVTNPSTVIDRTPPNLVSAATSSDGTEIILTYDEVLDSENGPVTADFGITVQGERRGASRVTVTGRDVRLRLATTVTQEQDVTVSYTDPTNNVDDLNAIQDRAGNDARNRTDEHVENESTVTDTRAPRFVWTAMSDDHTIILTYDEVLDAMNQPATTNFSVTVDGQSVDLSSGEREWPICRGGIEQCGDVGPGGHGELHRSDLGQRCQRDPGPSRQ